VFGVSIPLALVSPQLAILSWYLVLVLVVIRARLERRYRARASSATDELPTPAVASSCGDTGSSGLTSRSA